MPKVLTILFFFLLTPDTSFADYVRTGTVSAKYESWFTISSKDVNFYQSGNKRYKFPTRFKNYEIDEYTNGRCFTRLFSSSNVFAGNKKFEPPDSVVFPCRPL